MFPEDWMATSDVIRETAGRQHGVSSGREAGEETWWWEKKQGSVCREGG